jgi:hypothetical protein
MAKYLVSVIAQVYLEADDEFDVERLARDKFFAEIHTYSKHDLEIEIIEEIEEDN